MEQQFEKWNTWLNQIRADVETLVEYRKIFSDLRDIVNNNINLQKQKNNPFVNFIWDTYVAFIAITVRRQLKRNQDNSLVQLLSEIKDTPYLLSRKRFLSLFPQSEHENADLVFTHEFARLGEDCIDHSRVDKDLKMLKDQGEKLKDVTDKRIAHYDRQPPKSIPNLKEVDDLIDCLLKLTVKYWFLFKGKKIEDDLVPSIDNWQEIFREPWILPDGMSSVDPTEWWNTEGDKEWDKWSP